MVQVSVILPTYNEAENIIPLIREILTQVPLSSEIIVVDDDSPDRTWEAVEGFIEKESRVRLLRRIGRKGLTSALQEGINLSNGQYVFWMDCDFSMPPDKIPELLKALEDHDIAMASRYIPGGEEKGHSLLGSFLSRVICLAGLPGPEPFHQRLYQRLYRYPPGSINNPSPAGRLWRIFY